jgi:hypothetical protein
MCMCIKKHTWVCADMHTCMNVVKRFSAYMFYEVKFWK